MRKRPRHLTLFTLAVLLAGLAGCTSGDDGSSSGVASLADSSSAASTTPAGSADQAEQEVLAYVECLRGQGLDVPDPTVDGQGNLVLTPPGGDSGVPEIDPAQFEQAQRACGEVPAGITPAITGGDQSAFRDAALAFARCLREQGVEVGDPDFNGGVAAGPGGVFPGLDLQDPNTEQAAQECRSVFVDAGIDLPGGP